MDGILAIPRTRLVLMAVLAVIIGSLAFIAASILTHHGAPPPAPIHAFLRTYYHG